MHFNFEQYIARHIQAHAMEIDKDPIYLKKCLKQLALELSQNQPVETLFPNSDLEILFGASTAFAFTFWQHLALVERLNALPEWQSKNPKIWSDLRQFKILAGLAATHLAFLTAGTLTE